MDDVSGSNQAIEAMLYDAVKWVALIVRIFWNMKIFKKMRSIAEFDILYYNFSLIIRSKIERGFNVLITESIPHTYICGLIMALCFLALSSLARTFL